MRTAVLVAMILAATSAFGQTRPAMDESASADLRRVRYQIRVMERVLEQAVQHGAQAIGLRMRSFAPSTVLFTGSTRARGFKLDGYGVFFDVQVPTLRRSITWTFRTLSQHRVALGDALQALRQHVQSLGDPRARDSLEQALKNLEVQVGPTPTGEPSGTRATEVGGAEFEAVPAPVSAEADEDPGEVYVRQIETEVIDVMLDYSGSLLLAPDDWLTVAAIGAAVSFAPGEPPGGVTTMLRIRGRDLIAFRAGEVTREDARMRVETLEF